MHELVTNGFRPDLILSGSYELVANVLGFDSEHLSFESMGLGDTQTDSYGYFTLANFDLGAANNETESAVVELADTSATGTQEARPIYRLGGDPVDKDGFTPEQLKDPSKNPDLKENLGKAADALANADTSMPDEKVNAIKAAATDPSGWKEIKAGEINGKTVLMADGKTVGDFGAENRVLKLHPDTVVYMKEIEYTVDGKTYKETVYIPKDCANLSIDADVDPEEPQKPEVVPPAKTPVSYSVDPHHLACGDVKALLIADIHVPTTDKNDPAYIEAVRRGVEEAAKAQKAADSGFHDFTGVRIIGPDGKVLEVQCLEEGKTSPSDLHHWEVLDKSRKPVVLVTPANFDAVVEGTLDNNGDGIVSPRMGAKFENGAPAISLPANPDVWADDQLRIIRGDVMSDGGITPEQYDRMMGTTIPSEFFDMSYSERVRWLKDTYGISESAAKDFASYVGEYAGDLGKRNGVIHMPVTYEPKPGETFGQFMRNAAKLHHADMAARLK